MEDCLLYSLNYTVKLTGADIVRGLIKNNVHAAIFDIDGTLLDSMPIWDTLGARYLLAHGLTPEANLRDILFPMTIPESVHYLKAHYDLKENEDEIRNGLYRITEDFYKKEVPLKKGAEKLLRGLSDASIPMVLCTVGEAELAKAALTRLHVLSIFQDLFVCTDYQTTKQEPRIYEIAAAALHAKPAETVVFEDILQALSSAKTAGFQTAAVEDPANDSDRKKILETADYYLPDFTVLYAKRPCAPDLL